MPEYRLIIRTPGRFWQVFTFERQTTALDAGYEWHKKHPDHHVELWATDQGLLQDEW